MAFTARMKELMRKYGKVAVGVHVSVSCASIAGLYVAINNNVDVDAIFSRFGMHVRNEAPPAPAPAPSTPDEIPSFPTIITGEEAQERPRNRTRELVASSGGALALALMCNKALFPVRVPITIALTPPVSRFLARWKLVKT